MQNNFYVYAYIRAKNSEKGAAGTPYYIGKGKGNRLYQKHHLHSPKDKNRIIYIAFGLPEEEAFAAEKHYIKYYGRINTGTGCLYNRTDGGEGVSGTVFTPEMRAKLSLLRKGMKVSAETRAKMSALRIGKSSPARGRVRPTEERKKIAIALKGRQFSEETKNKISSALTGVKKSPEHRKKLSESQKKYFADPEVSIKLSKIRKGKKLSPETIAKRSASVTQLNRSRKVNAVFEWESQIKKAISIYGKPGFGFDREDLKQNCYIAILKAEDKIRRVRKDRGDDAAGGYVFVVCRNELLGNIRSAGKVKMVEYKEDFGQESNYDTRIDDALSSLKPEEESIIRSIYYTGLTAGQLAKTTGTSRRWIQSRKTKILKKLKELLHAR